MLVGIMADSHGRSLAVRAALRRFDELGVEFVIHCGDVGDEDTFAELVGRSFAFVWGNTDEPTAGLLAFLQKVNAAQPSDPPLRTTLGTKRFAVFHGHEPQFRGFRSLDVDYVLHGHTHVAADERVNHIRVINPGALFRAERKTVAVLETETDVLVFHEITAL